MPPAVRQLQQRAQGHLQTAAALMSCFISGDLWIPKQNSAATAASSCIRLEQAVLCHWPQQSGLRSAQLTESYRDFGMARSRTSATRSTGKAGHPAWALAVSSWVLLRASTRYRALTCCLVGHRTGAECPGWCTSQVWQPSVSAKLLGLMSTSGARVRVKEDSSAPGVVKWLQS